VVLGCGKVGIVREDPANRAVSRDHDVDLDGTGSFVFFRGLPVRLLNWLAADRIAIEKQIPELRVLWPTERQTFLAFGPGSTHQDRDHG